MYINEGVIMAKIKKQKRKKIRFWRLLKRTLILGFFFCLGGAAFSLGVTLFENVQATININRFKERATFESEEIVLYGSIEQTRRYYVVERTEAYELNDTRSVFEDDSERKHLGRDGDILLTSDSPFPFIPVFHQFMTSYYGGHAALKSEDLGYLQATGFPRANQSLIDIILTRGDEPHEYGNITAHVAPNDYWTNPTYRNETDKSYPYYGSYYRDKFFGVRVKDIDQEHIDQVIDFAESKTNQAIYNFLFFLDMQYKYYCTDFISRSYQSVMVPEEEQGLYSKSLNDDWFITSVNDILLSKQTYLTFYVEVKDDIFNIYYLEDL